MTDSPRRRVVVIGAGLGGISAAIALAADGHQVEVFEKNDHVGGKLNLLQTQGYSFDLGPSILTLPSIFERLFERHGRRMADHLRLRAVSPHWRCFFEGGVRMDLYPDPVETVQRNPALTQEDAQDLAQFMDYSRRLYERAAPGYFDRGLDTLWQLIRFYGPAATVRDFDLFSSMHEGVCRYVRNPYLRDILAFFAKYVGSSPYDAPAVLNLLPHAQAAYGLWYVEGGLYRLARALEGLAREAGVRLHLHTEVLRLDHSGGQVMAAQLADGRRVEGDVFICNMEVIPAYERLTGEPPAYLESLSPFEPSCSGLVVHLGVDRQYPHLAHHNFFFSRDPRKHFADVFHRKVLPEDPTIYVVAPVRSDPSQAPAGCEIIKLLPHIPYLQTPVPRSQGYAALRERVLGKVERMGLVDLRRHIQVEETWTPEDIERRYYSNRGAIYGVVADRRKNKGLKAPKKSRRYGNLYFVGGSVNPGGGMPMAALSGLQVRDRIAADASGDARGGHA